jgi:hypothetical protein
MEMIEEGSIDRNDDGDENNGNRDLAYEDDEFDDECDFEVNKKLCFCKLPARPRVTFPNVYHDDAETAKQSRHTGGNFAGPR